MENDGKVQVKFYAKMDKTWYNIVQIMSEYTHTLSPLIAIQ